MRNIIRLLTYSSFATIILLLVGCSSSLFDKDPTTCEKALPVSIVASIKSEYDFQNKPAPTTRADGVVVDDPDNDIWRERAEAMAEIERDIAHVFLFAYKRGETTPAKVILYFAPGKRPSGFDTSIDVKDLTVSGANISMDLELFPGFYNFVLIVNSKAALTAAEGASTLDPRTLEEDNEVLTSDDLTAVTGRKYLPMVGQGELFVPNDNSGHQVTLNPVIDLERVHARVEFFLTTQKPDPDTDYLSDILSRSEVKSLTLLNEEKRYTVMPSEDDYTMTANGQVASDNVIRAEKLANSTPMVGRESFHNGTEKSEQDKHLDKFRDRRLPYDISTKKELKYIYVAPSTLATSLEECLTLDFVVAFPDQTTEAEYTHYKIPLYNIDIKDHTDRKRYVTRRNTIYRIRAMLYGPDTFTLDYDVIVWEDQEVDIPW